MKKLLIAAVLFSTNVFAAEGLNGTYYNPPADTTGWWDGFNATSAYLASHPAADGSFIAKNINYNGGDLTSITDWLGADGASFTGKHSNMNDGVITLTGWIDFTSASETLNISHDDGFRLIFDGNKLAQNGCCGTDSVTINSTVGWHAIEVDYNNASYSNGGGANFAITQNDMQVISAADLSTTNPVPEPEQWAMILLGLPMISWMVRRKKTS